MQGISAHPKIQDPTKAQLVFSIFQGGLQQFLPLQPAWPAHPAHSTMGFLSLFPKRDGCKGEGGTGGGWRRGWPWLLPADRGPWRRRRACGRRVWGTRKELCSSCLHRDRASPAGSPPLQQAEEIEDGRDTPQHLSLSQWHSKSRNLERRALISNPKPPSSVDLGHISPLSSKPTHRTAACSKKVPKPK